MFMTIISHMKPIPTKRNLSHVLHNVAFFIDLLCKPIVTSLHVLMQDETSLWEQEQPDSPCWKTFNRQSGSES